MRRSSVAAALTLGSAVAACGGTATDPLPQLVPIERYDSIVSVTDADQLPARAVLIRHPDGHTVFALRAYGSEAGGVRWWDPLVDVSVAISSVDGTLVVDEGAVSSMSIEAPMESGFGSPALTLVIEQNGSFSGEVAADVVNEETGASRRVVATFAGDIEAVECDPDGGTGSVALVPGVSLVCTATEIGQTLGSTPPAD